MDLIFNDMELTDIVKSVNKYFETKFPDNTGWFIGRMTILPQTIKLYKKYNIELYYHSKSLNKLIINFEQTKRVTSDNEDRCKKEVLIEFISKVLENKSEIDKYGI